MTAHLWQYMSKDNNGDMSVPDLIASSHYTKNDTNFNMLCMLTPASTGLHMFDM